MSLKQKIEQAKQKSQEFQEKKQTKFTERKATHFNLLVYFNNLVVQIYDSFPSHTKRTKKLLGGLIKYLKNNGYDDKAIFEWIKEIVTHWSRYGGKKCVTDKGKEYVINIYPNLDDIIYCKKFFLCYNGEFECSLDNNEEQEDYGAIWKEIDD